MQGYVILSSCPSRGITLGMTASQLCQLCQVFVAGSVLMAHSQKLSSLVLVLFNFSVNLVLLHRVPSLASGVQLLFKVLRKK